MKKKVLYVLGGLVLLLGALGLGGQAWLKGRFEKEALLQEIESAWNCRAQLDSSGATFLSSPAKVELKGLKLAPRGPDAAQPPGLRTPLDPKSVVVSTDRAELSVELWDLLRGRVNVKKLRFEGLNLQGEVDKNGVSNLQTLFASPDNAPRVVKAGPDQQQTVAVTAGDVHASGVNVTDNNDKKPADAAPHHPTEPPPSEVKIEPKPEKKAEPFKAGNMPVSLQVDEAGIHNGRIEVTDHNHGTHSLLDHLHFELKDVDVNPSDLAAHDTCHIEFDGSLIIGTEDTATNTANLNLTGSGLIKPFDVEGGAWNPDLTLDVVVRKGSQLGGALMSENLKPKDAAKLKEYGVELGDIAMGGILGEDVTTEAHLFNGKLIIKKDTRLVFPQYEITVLEGSWFNSSQDSHSVHAKLIVGADLSARVMDQSKKKIAERYGDDLASIAETAIRAAFFDDKKQLVLPFKSKGSLSKPEISLDTVINDVKDLFKDAGSDLLKGLIGK